VVYYLTAAPYQATGISSALPACQTLKHLHTRVYATAPSHASKLQDLAPLRMLLYLQSEGGPGLWVQVLGS